MGIIKKFLSRVTLEQQAVASYIPGRNDSCWCGSGKKYKKCHLEEDEKKRSRTVNLNCGPS